jgi:hypothetical protein
MTQGWLPRMTQEACRMTQGWLPRMTQEACRMTQEACRMTQEACRMTGLARRVAWLAAQDNIAGCSGRHGSSLNAGGPIRPLPREKGFTTAGEHHRVGRTRRSAR